MISYHAKKSVIYHELKDDERKCYFDFYQKKFIHNIDSLYYVVKVENDWNHDRDCINFVGYLEKERKKAISQYDSHVLFQEDFYKTEVTRLGTKYTMNGIGSKPYLYDIEVKDKFIIFILHNRLNENTPELWVQLRSQYLWLYGEYRAVEESLKCVEEILNVFNIKIKEVTENRIDYAYHTNYIQDPLNFFKEENLNKMQESNFTRYSKEGKLVGQFEIESDYLTLGRKKSNNLFFRVYNKTKEVIEQGYKQFFIKLWYMEKLINYFDFYCIEKAFLRGNYNYLDIARLEFYLDYGINENIKSHIRNMLSDKNLDHEKIRKLADDLTPKVTIVCNIEIETKRKFYYSLDNSIDTLLKLKSDCPEYAKRLYLKLDNKKIFHDFLTKNNKNKEGVIRFLDYKAKNRYGKGWSRKCKYPTANWWKRLQSVNLKTKYEVDRVILLREYQKSLDIEAVKKRTINSLVTLSIYLHSEDNEKRLEEDIEDFMSTLNESDIQKAIENKEKKYILLKNRLKSSEHMENELDDIQ